MAAMDEYALEKVQFSPDRRYVKKDATKYVLLGSTNIHIFPFDIFQTCIFCEDFLFQKRTSKIHEAAHCFEMKTVTNASPCNVANVTRTRAQYGGH